MTTAATPPPDLDTLIERVTRDVIAIEEIERECRHTSEGYDAQILADNARDTLQRLIDLRDGRLARDPDYWRKRQADDEDLMRHAPAPWR